MSGSAEVFRRLGRGLVAVHVEVAASRVLVVVGPESPKHARKKFGSGAVRLKSTAVQLKKKEKVSSTEFSSLEDRGEVGDRCL